MGRGECGRGRSIADKAVRRAVEGVKKVKFYNGKPLRIHGELVYEDEYSDSLLAMLLRAINPAKYNPPKEVTNLLELDPEFGATEPLTGNRGVNGDNPWSPSRF
jgi:hypothetical protein